MLWHIPSGTGEFGTFYGTSDFAFLIKLKGQTLLGAFKAPPAAQHPVLLWHGPIKSVLDEIVNTVGGAATRKPIQIICKYAKVEIVVVCIPVPTVSVLREEASRD